jgi:capsular polysaccharide transport system permease protein
LPDAAERDAATPEGHSEASADIDAIRHEGLTGRQLRMARPVAQKNGMSVTSDFDAMRQLRLAGVDPFQRSTVLKLVAPIANRPAAPVRRDRRLALSQTCRVCPRPMRISRKR